MEILFLGSWKLEIMTYFWLNSVKIHDFDTHFLKSCVLMWHTCPHMSILGLQIHNTYTTRVELSTTQHTYSTYTHVYFFTSFFKYITQVQFRCVHNLYTCIHMWTYQTYTQLLKPIISKANWRIFHPFYGLVTKNKQKTTWMAEIIISCWF